MSAPKPPKKEKGRTGAATHKSSKQTHPNAASAQRQRIAEYLLKHGSADTEELRMQADVYHPPARILEMRHRYGWDIATVYVRRETAACGRVHRVGRYLLVQAPPATQNSAQAAQQGSSHG